MKKVVLKVDLHDEKCVKKAMTKVSGILGVESIDMDMNNKKLTLTGDIDPVEVVDKLKKICYTEIVSVGPAKKPETKKPEKEKEDDKSKKPQQHCPCFPYECHCHPYPTPAYYVVEEDPCRSSCAIC